MSYRLFRQLRRALGDAYSIARDSSEKTVFVRSHWRRRPRRQLRIAA